MALGCVAINSLAHYLLSQSITLHEGLVFALNLVLVIYGYVVLFPGIVWFVYRFVLKRRTSAVFKDCILLASCLGYSLFFDLVMGFLLFVFSEMRMMIFIFIVYQSGTFLCKSAGRLSFSGQLLAEDAESNLMICWLCIVVSLSFNAYLCFFV